jgi:hypothetical protein
MALEKISSRLDLGAGDRNARRLQLGIPAPPADAFDRTLSYRGL